MPSFDDTTLERLFVETMDEWVDKHEVPSNVYKLAMEIAAMCRKFREVNRDLVCNTDRLLDHNYELMYDNTALDQSRMQVARKYNRLVKHINSQPSMERTLRKRALVRKHTP